MKIINSLSLIVLCFVLPGCSPTEQIEFGKEYPELAPTTRAVERIEQRLDPIAQRGEQLSGTVRDVATQAEAIGIPGAGMVALAASVLGTILGVYNERRRGTIPMKTAVEQIVKSVETAFPEKSDMQKSMMASMQDRTTQKLVSEIKGR